MLNKIVLAGGRGFLGHVLAHYFRNKAKDIVVLSRKAETTETPGVKTVLWDAETTGNWITSLEGADLVVNLCGKNVNCRYTEEAKKEIFRSRLVPTELLGNVIKTLADPPKVWINAASATIYRHAEDRPQDEDTGDIGTGFSVDVCTAWEESFWKTDTPQTRKVALRVGLVLGTSDGVFPRLKTWCIPDWADIREPACNIFHGYTNRTLPAVLNGLISRGERAAYIIVPLPTPYRTGTSWP